MQARVEFCKYLPTALFSLALQSLDMLEGLPKVGVTPDDVTYSTIMCTCNEAGQYAQTIALYKQMVAKGLRVNDVAGRRGMVNLIVV